MPPRPRIASVRFVGSCDAAAVVEGFQLPARRDRSPKEYWRRVEMRRYNAVVAVASSTAPGVFETEIPAVCEYQ